VHPDATRVSVVIPTLEGGPRFREVLEALCSQDLPGGFELLVIDSGSRDGTADAARAAGARVASIPRSEFNHGGTRNRAIALAKGELVAFLTQDAIPIGPRYLADLLRPFERPNVDGVYGRQFPRPDCDPILADRLRAWSASRDLPALQVLAPGDPVRSRALFAVLPPMERYLTSAFDNVASAIRRSTWQRIPFPERSFGEDVAWAREVVLAGGAIAYEPAACVEHSHRIELVREFRRVYCDHRNLCELFGLRNVPTWKAVRSGGRAQARHYAELLADMHLSPMERLYWRLYSIPHAFLETAAQFLGARSIWKGNESAFWRGFDQRVRRGM
jgi:rhamnosyltransferase